MIQCTKADILKIDPSFGVKKGLIATAWQGEILSVP